MNGSVTAGAFTDVPITTSRGATLGPYRSVLSSVSGLTTPPDRLTPANNPCVREYDRISAFICASVAARASRPTGPPAIDASAPSVTLLRSIFSMPLAFITSSTRSIDCAPICSPQLPLPTCMNTGALHSPLWRQLINPLPYSPPMTNAAFFRPGTTITHSALSHSSCGHVLVGNGVNLLQHRGRFLHAADFLRGQIGGRGRACRHRKSKSRNECAHRNTSIAAVSSRTLPRLPLEGYG